MATPPPLQSEGGNGHPICTILINACATRLQYDYIVFCYIEEMACQSPTLPSKRRLPPPPFQIKKGMGHHMMMRLLLDDHDARFLHDYISYYYVGNSLGDDDDDDDDGDDEDGDDGDDEDVDEDVDEDGGEDGGEGERSLT